MLFTTPADLSEVNAALADDDFDALADECDAPADWDSASVTFDPYV